MFRNIMGEGEVTNYSQIINTQGKSFSPIAEQLVKFNLLEELHFKGWYYWWWAVSSLVGLAGIKISNSDWIITTYLELSIFKIIHI